MEIGFKSVEKDGLEVWLLQHWSFSVHKHQKGFTYPNASFEKYTFILSISTFDMKPLLSCSTSNAILDIDRPQIGGERWIRILVATALVISPQQAQKISHILMTNLINTD